MPIIQSWVLDELEKQAPGLPKEGTYSRELWKVLLAWEWVTFSVMENSAGVCFIYSCLGRVIVVQNTVGMSDFFLFLIACII